MLDTKSAVVLRGVAVSGLDAVHVTGGLSFRQDTRINGVTEIKSLADGLLQATSTIFDGPFLVVGSSLSLALFSKTQFNADVNVLVNNIHGSLLWQGCTF